MSLADAFNKIAEGFAEAAIALSAAEAGGPTKAPAAPPAPVPFEDTPQARSAQGGCVVHDVPWVIRPAGNSKKTGEPYNAFWHCNEQNADGSFCREKPAPAWVKAHPIP